VTTPYCGHLRWTYTTANALSGPRTYNEVQNRFLSMSSGAAETEIALVRATDTPYTVHSSATLQDSPAANAEKIWTFQTGAGFSLGLELSYEELTLSTSTGLSLLNFTWAQTPTSLNPYNSDEAQSSPNLRGRQTNRSNARSIRQLAHPAGVQLCGISHFALTFPSFCLTDWNMRGSFV
jgi:hypothetical protein